MENRLLRCRRSCLVLVEMQKPPPTIHPGVFFPSPPNISSSEGLSNVLLSLFKFAILVFHLKFFAPATCYYTESKWWWCLVYNPPLFFSTCLMYRRFTYRRRKKNFGFIVHPLVSHSIRWVFFFFACFLHMCKKKHETRSITDQKFTRDLLLGCSSFSHLTRSIPSSYALFNNVSFNFEFKAVNIKFQFFKILWEI